MKIIKFKKLSGDKYRLTLEDNQTIDLYMDLILKEELLLTKEINDLDQILRLNKKYAIYDEAIDYLKHKLRTTQEVKEYLLKQSYQIKDINEVIQKLTNQGYLNDEIYSKCYINDRINLSLDGPLKISKYLDSMGIDKTVYDKHLCTFTSELVKTRIDKYLTKQLKTNKKSMYIFKNKALYNLVNLGYYKEDILNSLETLPEVNQTNLKEQEKEKLYKKLSHKYSGELLDKKVREKLYQKGFFE